MTKGNLIMKGLVAALIIATIGTSTVSASAIREGEIGDYKKDMDVSEFNNPESYYNSKTGISSSRDKSWNKSQYKEKHYITDINGNIATYTKAGDFDRYELFEEFIYNARSGYEDILYVRKGLTAKDFLKIITCNQPTHMVDDEYVYQVNKNSDGTMSVITTRKVEGEGVAMLREKYKSIINEIITDNMNDYEKAKAIYDYIYENVRYSKGTQSNAYDVLVNGEKANSDTITAIAGNLLERAGVQYGSVVGVSSKNKFHYFNYVSMGSKSYVFDVSLDLANSEKYGHFLTATNNLEYKLGALQQSFMYLSNEDYKK